MNKYVNRDDVVVAFGQSLNNMLSRDDGEQVAMSLIKGIPTVELPTWIPCSERLPEEKEWIGTKQFGTTISDLVHVTLEAQGERFVKPMRFQNGELGGSDKRTMDAFYDEWKAVAWMPLPRPYEEEDHE